jgi:hypothetical protein
MLESAGYPDVKGALQRVSNAVGVPSMTISRWFKGRNNPVPNEVVTEKASDLKTLLRAEIDEALKEMPNARGEASYRDIGTVLGILIDKLQLLENKPTERIDHQVTLTDEERTSRAMELLNAARTRRDGRASERIQ